MIGLTRPKECCVGCGYCCFQKPCSFCQSMFPYTVNCPLLEWDGNRYRCSLLKTPGKQGDYYRQMLLIGEGCRAYLNPWRQDVRKRNGRDG